jgi:hypothetical protein
VNENINFKNTFYFSEGSTINFYFEESAYDHFDKGTIWLHTANTDLKPKLIFDKNSTYKSIQ